MFKRFSGFLSRVNTALAKRPVFSFFGLIILLFGFIAMSHYLRTPKAEEKTVVVEKKAVAIFNPSKDTAFLTVPAEVKKENVVNIVALVPGIITSIRTAPGKSVFAGQMLLEMTHDYQSGSASIQKKIAQNNDTLIQKLAKIDKRIFELREKQTDDDDTLTKTEKKLELKQLEEDRAQSKIDIQNSALNLQLTNVNDAVLKPKTFISGIVETIYVQRGEFVSAGDTLATIRTNAGATTIEALVSKKTATLFDPTKNAVLRVGTETIGLLPTYFSQNENKDGLFSILFTLSETTKERLVNGEFLSLDIPLRTSDPTSLLIPIDAIYQEESGTSIMTLENDVVTSKTVTLGNIYGGFALVTSDLVPDTNIVLDRSVITGESVTIR